MGACCAYFLLVSTHTRDTEALKKSVSASVYAGCLCVLGGQDTQTSNTPTHAHTHLHGLGLFEGAHELRDGGALLANANVDAHKRVVTLRLLVDDGVDSNGGLA